MRTLGKDTILARTSDVEVATGEVCRFRPETRTYFQTHLKIEPRAHVARRVEGSSRPIGKGQPGHAQAVLAVPHNENARQANDL